MLRRLLAAELGRDSGGDWHETRVWCGQCGRRKLAMRQRDLHDAVTFSCPDCSRGVPGSDFAVANPVFAGPVAVSSDRPRSSRGRAIPM